jgi:hypothetical protein
VQRGRLILPDGAIVSCSYEFSSADSGFLDLASAFTSIGERVDGATLELANGERRGVTVTFGSRVGQASFVCS